MEEVDDGVPDDEEAAPVVGFKEPDPEPEKDPENWMFDPLRWHPALGIQILNAVPQTMGARIGVDGNIEILQVPLLSSRSRACTGVGHPSRARHCTDWFLARCLHRQASGMRFECTARVARTAVKCSSKVHWKSARIPLVKLITPRCVSCFRLLVAIMWSS